MPAKNNDVRAARNGELEADLHRQAELPLATFYVGGSHTNDIAVEVTHGTNRNDHSEIRGGAFYARIPQ
jgi:hypothetical protein